MKAYRCKRCSHVFRPRRLRCIKCKSRDLEEISLTRGRLISYTEIYATRRGYPSPLRIGLAEFGHGVRLLAQLDCEDPETGMEVVPVKPNTMLKLRRA